MIVVKTIVALQDSIKSDREHQENTTHEKNHTYLYDAPRPYAFHQFLNLYVIFVFLEPVENPILV